MHSFHSNFENICDTEYLKNNLFILTWSILFQLALQQLYITQNVRRISDLILENR